MHKLTRHGKKRESTIRFMLSDVKDNSFNKITTTTDDVENGKKEIGRNE